LDDFAANCANASTRCPAKTVLAIINQYLFDELGFTGNEEDYYDRKTVISTGSSTAAPATP